MNEDALTVPNPQRLTMTERATIHGAYVILDLHSGFREHRHWAVVFFPFFAATASLQHQAWPPFMSHQKHLLVVGAWILFWFDIDHRVLPAVGSSIKAGRRGHGMAMEIAGARLLRYQRVAKSPICRNHLAALLHRAVDGDGNRESMPVGQLVGFRRIDDLDG